MLIIIIPLLVAMLPTLLQVGFTFYHLHHHSRKYLWSVFLVAVPLQLVFGIVAMLISMRGIAQNGVQCAIGAGVFFAGGIASALIVTPALALLAVVLRWLNPQRPYAASLS